MTREAIPAAARPKLARRARLQPDRLGGQTMLVYPEGLLSLNPTALAIVTLCQGEKTLADIVAELAARYRVPLNEIQPEVEQFLDALRARNLLDGLTTLP